MLHVKYNISMPCTRSIPLFYISIAVFHFPECKLAFFLHLKYNLYPASKVQPSMQSKVEKYTRDRGPFLSFSSNNPSIPECPSDSNKCDDYTK